MTAIQEKILVICVLTCAIMFTASTIVLIFSPNIWACLGLPLGAIGALMCADRLTEEGANE